MAARSDPEHRGSKKEADCCSDWDAVTANEISPTDIDALSSALRPKRDDSFDKMKAAKIDECCRRLFFGEAPRDSLECLLLMNTTELKPLDIPVRVVEGSDFGFVTSSVGSRTYVIPPSATNVELPSEKDLDEGLVERDPYTDPTRSCLSVLSTAVTDGSVYQAKPSETRVEIGESRSSSTISTARTEGSFYEKPPSEAHVEMDSRLSELNSAVSDASFYEPFPSEIVVEMGINNSKLAQLKKLVAEKECNIVAVSDVSFYEPFPSEVAVEIGLDNSKLAMLKKLFAKSGDDGCSAADSELNTAVSQASFYEPFPSEIAVEMGINNSKLAQLKKLLEEIGDEGCSTADEFSMYSAPPSEAHVELAN